MGSAGAHVATLLSAPNGACTCNSTECACAAATGKHQSLTAAADGRILAEADCGTEAKAANIAAHSFLIAAGEVQQMLAQRGMSEDALLRSLIVPASKLARPYISKFHVGCGPYAPLSFVHHTNSASRRCHVQCSSPIASTRNTKPCMRRASA